ncbi:hypothetical protein [Nonomuraea sp. NPDC005650]|uniref:hypothetical protein n=1 Tax=Nonomuraea sp. NPDC005650 TaxID=3157045 RepID=UPI0033AEE524
MYEQLGLHMTYDPAKKNIDRRSSAPAIMYQIVSEGGLEPFAYLVEQGEQWLELD